MFSKIVRIKGSGLMVASCLMWVGLVLGNAEVSAPFRLAEEARRVEEARVAEERPGEMALQSTLS